MTTPALDAAVRIACSPGGRHCTFPMCEPCSRDVPEVVKAALRSLSTPTPEVIEAMARAHDPVGWAWYDHVAGQESIDGSAGRSIREARSLFFADQTKRARAAFTAMWALILGETK